MSNQRAPVSTSSTAPTTTEDNFLQQLDVVVSQLQRRNPTGYPLTFPPHLIGHEDEYARVESQHRASRLVFGGGTANAFLAAAGAQRNNSPTSINGPDATLASFSHPGGLFFEGSSSPSAACPPQPASHEDPTIAWLLEKASTASTGSTTGLDHQHGKHSTSSNSGGLAPTAGLPPSVACHLSATLQRSAVALDRLSPSVTLSASFAKYLEKSEGAIRRERDRRQSRFADGSRVRVSKEGQQHAMDSMTDEDLEKYYLYNGLDDEGEGNAGDDKDVSDENQKEEGEEENTNNKGQGFAFGKDAGAVEAALLTPLRTAPQSSSSVNDGSSGQQHREGGRGNDMDLGQWWLYFNTLKAEGADLLENITSLVSDLEQMQRATTAVTVQSNALSENASTLLARKAELERTSSALSAVLQHFAAMDDCYRAAHHPGLSASNPNFAKLLDDVEDSIAFLTSVSIPASRVLAEKRKELQDNGTTNILNGDINTHTTATVSAEKHQKHQAVDDMEAREGGGQNHFFFRPIEFKSAKTFTNRMASVHQMLVAMLKDSLNASFEAAAGAVVGGSSTTATVVAEHRSKFADPTLSPPTPATATDQLEPYYHQRIDTSIPKELALIWQRLYAENAYLRCFTSPQRAMTALQQRGWLVGGLSSHQAFSGLSTLISGGGAGVSVSDSSKPPKPEASKDPTPTGVPVGGAPPNALPQHSHTTPPHPHHLPILSEEQRRQQQINAAVAAANEAAAEYMDEKVTAMLQPLLLQRTNDASSDANDGDVNCFEDSETSGAVCAAASEASAELSRRLRETLNVINTNFSAYVTDVVSAAAAGHAMERQQQQQPSQSPSQYQSNPNRHHNGYGPSQYNVVPTGPSAAALRRVFEARCPRAFRESLPHLLGTNTTADGGGKMHSSSSTSSRAFSPNHTTNNAPPTASDNNNDNNNNPILALEMSLFEETMGSYSRVRMHLIGPIIRDHLESFAEACRRVLASGEPPTNSEANDKNNTTALTKGNAPNNNNNNNTSNNNTVVEVLRNALQLGSSTNAASLQLLLQKGGAAAGGSDERQLIMLSLIAERTVAVLRDVLLEENTLYESLWLPAAAAAAASTSSSSSPSASVVMTLCPALVNDISDAAYQFYRSFVVQTDSFSSLAIACSYFLSVLVAGCSSPSENRHENAAITTTTAASTSGHGGGRLDGKGSGGGDALQHIHVGTLLSCLLGSASVLPAAILSRSAATTAAIGTALFVQQEAQQRVASLLLHERRRTKASGPTNLSPTSARRSPLSVSSLFQRSSPTAEGHHRAANTNTSSNSNNSNSAAASSLVINSTGGVSLANKATTRGGGGGGAKGEDSNNKSGFLPFGGSGGASSSASASDSSTTTSSSSMGPLVLIRMLQDTQERLVFRCSLHLRHEIGGNKNDPREAVLLLRLNLSTSSSGEDNSLSSSALPAAVVLQDMPSVVVKGVAFMNLLFPVVDEKVFNLFAEECMRMLRASIVVSGNEIARLSTERVQSVFAEVLTNNTAVPAKMTFPVSEVGGNRSMVLNNDVGFPIENDHQQGKVSGQPQTDPSSGLLLASLKESVAKDLKRCPIALHSMLSQLRSLLQLRELITRYPSAFAVPTTEKRFDLAALVLKRRFDVTTKTIDVKRDIEEDIRTVCESIIEAASGLCWGAFSTAESSLSRRPILPPMPQMTRSSTPAVAVGGSAAAVVVASLSPPPAATADHRHGQTTEDNNTTAAGLNDEPMVTTPNQNNNEEGAVRHHQTSPTPMSPTAMAIVSSPLPTRTPPTTLSTLTIGASSNPLDACTSQLADIADVMRRYIDNAATRAVILRPIRELTCEKSGGKIAMSSLLFQNE